MNIKRLVCPLLSIGCIIADHTGGNAGCCIGDGCAWWDFANAECTVTSCASMAVDGLIGILDSIDRTGKEIQRMKEP